MAGTNKVLKEGQVLFRAGDKSDGMYLIRRGELRVYLEQDGKEVPLATIGEGGMIGEMALFDNQPRSASVKASQETEVTLISLDEFGKLMKQIPKWFVGLMSALSSRLRQTNERLKKLESAGGAPAARRQPYQGVLRQLHLMILLWHKDGQKDGKEWVLPKLALEQTFTELFGEDPEKIRALLEVLIKQKMLGSRLDAYKNVVLSTANRAALSGLTTFITSYVKANPKNPVISPEVVGMLRVLERVAQTAPYDTSTVTLADLMKEGKRDGLNTNGWEKALATFTSGAEDVKVVKVSAGLGLRSVKKDVATYTRNAEVVAALYKANLT